ncbi:hypothetical protein BKA63DRAFT_599720 [Paraphoma chrysanthemicola]|nr:hypothetical protein BKA63DRAFT_599720 [Paraphoma chrysanthemicola]
MGGTEVEFGGIRVDISQFDFSDTRSRVHDVQTANIVMIVVVLTVVSLRLFARIKFVKQIFADDVFIVLAAVFTLALSSTCIAATRSGLGTHIWLFDLATVFDSVKSCILYLFICQILYAFSIALTKIAIITSYLRFIQTRNFRILMYVTLGVTIGLWICGIFVTIFQCRPISGAWDYNVQNSCIPFIDYLYASSAVNVFTDIVLCVAPIPHLWRLNMPLRQRIILCILFIGGAGACVAGSVRIGYLDALRVLDVPFASVPSLNLSVIECSLGIVCVSIPPLRPMFIRLVPQTFRTARSTSAKSKSRNIPLSSVSMKPKTQDSSVEHAGMPNQERFQRLHSMEEGR